MREIIIFIIALISIPLVFASPIIDYFQVPTADITEIETKLEDVKIENTGFEKVFIALPEGWTIDEADIMQTGYRSYSVLTGLELYDRYGSPEEPNAFINREKVITHSGYLTKFSTTIDGRIGWWLYPNEGLIINLVATVPVGSAYFDPFELERGPNIKINQWFQRFTLTVSDQGFVTAPYIIKTMPLVEATPGIYSDARDLGVVYYDDFTMIPSNVPKWNEWFGFTNPLSKSPISALETTLKFYPIEKKEEFLVPVFKVSPGTSKIHYAYEWDYYREIEGVTVKRSSLLKTVPKWDEWF